MSNSKLESIFRIPPYYYIHVLDQTSNVTRVELGPKTFIRQDNEQVSVGPIEMVIVPPNHFCIIQNPAVCAPSGTVLTDRFGQVRLKHADFEVRLEQDPFPLYPGENLYQKVTPLQVVHSNSALLLLAKQDFEDEDTVIRAAGDKWLFEGPGVYIPRKEVKVLKRNEAIIVKPNQALKLRALLQTTDRDGKVRVAGEEWLVKKVGSYLLGAYEELVEQVSAYILTEKEAIHVKALRTFTDEFGQTRKNGQEWLITMSDTETYIPDVYVEVVIVVTIMTLNSGQFCFIDNPVGADGKPQLGQKKLIKGECSFFLNPGEICNDGIQECYVLTENQGLVLRATMDYTDDNIDPPVIHKPGDKWMIRGPLEYVPSIEVEILEGRLAVPLDENEGLYVRDKKTGKVRVVCGISYMLNQDEEVWEKEISPTVKDLLSPDRDNLKEIALLRKAPQMKMAMMNEGMAFGSAPMSSLFMKRSAPTRPRPQFLKIKPNAITFRVPHNAVVQVYDYKQKKARVLYGPDLVLLGPNEEFTQVSLSGGCPKQPHVIRSLCLLLGPDFCTDKITVETADHARLQLQLSYSWYFDVTDKSVEASSKLFCVPDFVGDFCKAIASRIRAKVASTSFDDFHKHSANIIRAAVFGYDDKKKICNKLVFNTNNLCVTSVDIQSVEPVDERTRDSLQKSVQMAIEITTQSQEATAKQEALKREQEARGKLERQRIDDEVEAEKVRKALLELQAASIAVESCGQAKADALSRAEAQQIEGNAAVEHAKSKSEAVRIESEVELEQLMKAREAEISFVSHQNNLEIEKEREMCDLAINKFKQMVSAIGSNTIEAIALAGPQLQVKLLEGLGLSSTILTDGRTPLNLFTTAQGLIGSLANNNV